MLKLGDAESLKFLMRESQHLFDEGARQLLLGSHALVRRFVNPRDVMADDDRANEKTVLLPERQAVTQEGRTAKGRLE